MPRTCSGSRWTRSRWSANSARWCSRPPPRTSGSTPTTPRCTACWTTASAGCPPDEPRTNLGGDEWANEWPKKSAWDFVALGKGHDVAFWTEFLRALQEVDPGMLVNIEHEDTELGRIEGLEVAAAVLHRGRRRAGQLAPPPADSKAARPVSAGCLRRLLPTRRPVKTCRPQLPLRLHPSTERRRSVAAVPLMIIQVVGGPRDGERFATRISSLTEGTVFRYFDARYTFARNSRSGRWAAIPLRPGDHRPLLPSG